MSGTVRQGIALHTNVESLVKNKQAARVLGEPHVRRSFTRWVALRNARPVCSGGSKKKTANGLGDCVTRLGDCVTRLTVGPRPRGSQLARPRGSGLARSPTVGGSTCTCKLLLLAARCICCFEPNTPQNTNTPLCFVWLRLCCKLLRFVWFDRSTAYTYSRAVTRSHRRLNRVFLCFSTQPTSSQNDRAKCSCQSSSKM